MLKHDEAVVLARGLIEGRHRRSEHLPADLFGDHAWHLLLVLFLADAEGEAMTTVGAASRAGISRMIAVRWLRLLAERDLVSASNDPDVDIVTLTAQGLYGVEACLRDFMAMVKRMAAPPR